ncbi:MAG TPA: DUF4296 domain-containing protein [Chitinophagaceae bacterium]
MSRVLLFLIVVVFFTACGKNDRPDDTLSRTKMENIIWDMVMADEYLQTILLKDTAITDIKAERYKLYEQVFKLHNISREQFRKSYEYYASRPQDSKVLFDSLSARANRRIEEVYKNPQ